MATCHMSLSSCVMLHKRAETSLAATASCVPSRWQCCSSMEDSEAANRPGGNPSPSSSVRYRSELERLYEWDSSVPSEAIEKPRAVATMMARSIGEKPPCSKCRCVGLVECATCDSSGLYVEPVLESQGVVVKVRCLGCGGSGNLMCPRCGGRGHL